MSYPSKSGEADEDFMFIPQRSGHSAVGDMLETLRNSAMLRRLVDISRREATIPARATHEIRVFPL